MSGPNALVTIDKSIESMVTVINSTDIKCTGKFQISMERHYLGKARATSIFL